VSPGPDSLLGPQSPVEVKVVSFFSSEQQDGEDANLKGGGVLQSEREKEVVSGNISSTHFGFHFCEHL